MKDLIKKLKAEGKTADQICAEIAKDSEKSIEEVVAEVRKELKALDAQEAFKGVEAKEEAQKAEKSKLSAEVKEAVKEVLKDMPAVKEEPKKEVKMFNSITGKHEDYAKMSDSYKAVADSLYYSLKGDMKSVESIKNEVDSEVKRQLESIGVKTALYTDATTGSYLIPTEVSSDIAVSRYDKSVMYQKANKAGILFNSKVYPVATDMTFSHRTNENTAWGDVTPTIENPTITVKEYGGLALLSRRLVELRSPQVVQMLVDSAGSADARFIDLATAIYSVTTNSDPFNGLVFDSKTAGVDDKALSAISEDDFVNLINKLSNNVNDITFIANRKVRMKYGNLENSAGNKIFANFMSNGQIAPMGYDFIENRQIASTLAVNASSGVANKRTGGTSDVLICADLSKLLIVAGMMRIDYSEHYKFAEDQVAWKFVNEIGCGTVTDTGNVVASVIELTN